jgi:hypothetical protein
VLDVHHQLMMLCINQWIFNRWVINSIGTTVISKSLAGLIAAHQSPYAFGRLITRRLMLKIISSINRTTNIGMENAEYLWSVIA